PRKTGPDEPKETGRAPSLTSSAAQQKECAGCGPGRTGSRRSSAEPPKVFFAALICEQGAQVGDPEEAGVGVAGTVGVVAPGAVDVDRVGLGEPRVAFHDDEVFVVAGAGGAGEVVAAGDDGRILGEGVDQQHFRVDDRVSDPAQELR